MKYKIAATVIIIPPHKASVVVGTHSAWYNGLWGLV